MLRSSSCQFTAHELALSLEKYSIPLFKELLRLQSYILPPRSERQIYRTINRYTFQQYTRLPKLISDALFQCFSRNDKLDSAMLYSGLLLLIECSIEESSSVTFAMLDSDGDELISQSDCNLMLNHSVANPAFICEGETAKMNRIMSLAIYELFDWKQQIDKKRYMSQALAQENSVHTLLWDFIKQNFNVSKILENFKLMSVNSSLEDSKVSEGSSQDSTVQIKCSGFLIREQNKKFTKRFYRLVNQDLIEFMNPKDNEFSSFKHLGHGAFLLESRIKHGDYYKFTIQSGAQIHTFYSVSQKDHDQWIEGLRRVLGRHIRKVTDFYLFKEPMSSSLTRAKSQRDGSYVMIRSIPKEGLSFENYEQIRLEIEILEICKSQSHITKITDYFEDPETFHLVFSQSSRANLKKYYLKELKDINYSAVRAIAKQLCRALSFLKKFNILHRNINPSTVYLTGTTVPCQDQEGMEIQAPEIQLGDFYEATILLHNESSTKVCGLASFLAPEAIKFKSYSFPADMYSLGVTIYFIMTGQVPFFHKDIKEFYKKILNKPAEVSVDFMLNSPADLVQFVTALVVKNPLQRLSIQEIFSCLKEDQRFVGICKLQRSTCSLSPVHKKK